MDTYDSINSPKFNFEQNKPLIVKQSFSGLRF